MSQRGVGTARCSPINLWRFADSHSSDSFASFTTEAIAKIETLNQIEAWKAFDRWIEKGGAVYLDEPLGLDIELRELTNQSIAAPKELSDSYLAAFATAASLNLVTFDKALSRKARRSVLLGTSVEESQ